MKKYTLLAVPVIVDGGVLVRTQEALDSMLRLYPGASVAPIEVEPDTGRHVYPIGDPMEQ